MSSSMRESLTGGNFTEEEEEEEEEGEEEKKKKKQKLCDRCNLLDFHRVFFDDDEYAFPVKQRGRGIQLSGTVTESASRWHISETVILRVVVVVSANWF